MPREGFITSTGYIWTRGKWAKIPGFVQRRTPPRRNFCDHPDEGILRDIAPQMRGDVFIDVHEVQPDGSKVLVEQYKDHVEIQGNPYDTKNLIVAKAPLIMANALGGVSYPDWVIGGVQWGTGGHADGDPSTPVPPTVDDLELETFVLETSISGVSTGDTYVQFETSMGTGSGNGNVFTEAGLVITGITKEMFARKTFPGITKTSNRTITLRWIISFIQTQTGSDCQGIGLFGQNGPIRQHRYVVPSSPPSYTEITVPLSWPAGLNRLWVWRNGVRVFAGETYTENYPTGITGIDPPLDVDEVWVFEVLE